MKKALTKIIFFTLLLHQTTSLLAVDEKDVSKMLNDFQKKGILSKEELIKAQDKLKKISPEKWSKIKAYTQSQTGKKGAQESSNDVDTAAAQINTDSKEFKKTMNDLKEIMVEP